MNRLPIVLHALVTALPLLAAAGCARAEPQSPPSIRDEPPPRLDRRSHVVRTVERAAPAVVNISTETLVRNPYYGRGSLFDLFFGGGMPMGEPERYVANSLGSGVIVDPRGYVVTNEHVVAAASRITVTFIDGRQVEAELIGSASDNDLAVLKLTEPGTYPFLSVDFDEKLYPGETVVAIGNPFGLQSSVTTGVLSATHRRVQSGGQDFTDFLQTDAAINPGNSGGALLTVNGDLIGINTQIEARGQNLGFAIPIWRVRKVFDELVRFGEVRESWLGIEVDSLDLDDGRVARKLGVPGGRGMLVRRVHPETAAARAGVEPGDVLLELGGERVRDEAEYHTVVSRLKSGQRVAAVAWRSGARIALELVAESFPVERGAELLWRHLGLALESAAGRGGARYVAIGRVRPDSSPAEIGLRPGFAVLAVDGVVVERPEDVYRALPRGLSRRSMLFVISDGRGTYRVPLPVA